MSVVRVEGSVDEVQLRDGSFVRGTIAEVATGSHVSISIGDEQRRIPWAEIDEVRLATAATEPPPTAEPVAAAPVKTPPAPAAQTKQPGPGRPRVHIESTNGIPVSLYGIDGELAGSDGDVSIHGIFYRPICRGTCDEVVDGSRGNEFFVGGDRLMRSRTFTLADDSGDVTLKVRAGRRAMFGAGLGLTPLGILLVGGILMAKQTPGQDPFTGEVERGPRPIAVSFIVIGVIGLAVGIPLLIAGRTTVKKRSASHARRRGGGLRLAPT